RRWFSNGTARSSSRRQTGSRATGRLCASSPSNRRRSMPRRKTSLCEIAARRSELAATELDYLKISGIEAVYNGLILVLKGVSLEVPRGKIVALLGANGAGKTTTLKAISNLLRAERGEVTRGSIEFEGR